jgi:protocatechuate 3,4-dioxygenase beta subunit
VVYLPAGTTQVATADADSGGAFTLAELNPGTYEIWASSDTGEQAHDRLTIVPGSTPTLKLRLSAIGALVTGNVVDSEGGPVNGAAIQVSGGAAGIGTIVGAAESDEAGRFKVRLPAGNYFLTAAMAGYASKRQVLLVGAGGAEAQVELTAAAAVAGQVVAAEGTSAPGAQVFLRPSVSSGTRAELVANADGRFSFDDVEPGRYFVFAVLGGLRSDELQLDLGWAERRQAISLELHAGLSVAGVVQALDGVPISGARIKFQQSRGLELLEPITVVSDATGRFQHSGLSAQAITLIVSHDQYGTSTVVLGRLGSDREDVAITLTASRLLRGEVVGAGGRPAPGAQVWATCDQMLPVGGTAFADDTGTYAVSVHPESTQCSVSARHVELGLGSVEVTVGGEERVRIALTEPRYVSGTVEDTAGNPVGFTKVTAMRNGRGPAGNHAFALADAAGRFRLGPLFSGEVVIQARGAQGAGTPRGDKQVYGQARVALETLRDSEGVVVVLPERNQALHGQVTDSAGQPVPSARVVAAVDFLGQAQELDGIPTTTDLDGNFVFERMATATYQLFVEADGYAPTIKAPVQLGPGQPNRAVIELTTNTPQ